MKLLLFISLITFLQDVSDLPHSKSDELMGYYYVTDPKTKENVQMEIYKTTDGKYEAKIVWVESKNQCDQIGTVQVRNLTYDPKSNEWKNGRVKYDGSEYRMTVSFVESKKLKVRGFLGIALLGKTVYWIKEDELRK